jgi:hypothetical protein
MSNKISIDFDIKSDPYYLKVTDFSTWGLIKEKPAIIEITLPGDSTPVTKYFGKKQVNIFNSNILGSNCLDCENTTLEDGIYIIKVTGSPSDYNKELKYLKTDLLQANLDKLIIDSFNSPTKENILNKVTEIEFYLKGAESHLRMDLEREARMMFEQASALLTRALECKTC